MAGLNETSGKRVKVVATSKVLSNSSIAIV